MLELAILGFLADGPLPGHLLRRQVSQLTGYTRPVSDGSLYPAINRLAGAGMIARRTDPAAGSGRYMLNLTDAGRAHLLDRLRDPAQHEITDFTRFFVVPGIPVSTAQCCRSTCRTASPAGVPGATGEFLLRRRTAGAGRGGHRPVSAWHAAHRARHLYR